ncbi:fumarylacetoacetate hydrolase family protein [Brevibacillus sp. NRS-1366]|uniref:fumarylacetoacetate hydrolase family protein n=1 Tax=Brevibacillus sp. NRS-1366 TaxID=3233899 RepID=UPI003D216731
MKLITFEYRGSQRIGALIEEGNQAVDLLEGAMALKMEKANNLSSMLTLIESGATGLELAREVVSNAPNSSIRNRDEIRLLAPLPTPVSLRDCALIIEHLENVKKLSAQKEAEQNPDVSLEELLTLDRFRVPSIYYEKVMYYNSSRTTISGPEEDIEIPNYTEWLDFELEFSAVIGKRGKNISRDCATDYIFGYTIFNDWSARDEQMLVMAAGAGLGKGKDFDGSNGFGPCIVTADEIGDPYNLMMIARVNGEELTRGNTDTMHHKFEDAIAHLSRSQTLYPGEIIGSGTVLRGCGLEHDRKLNAGDVVELEIEKIGVLRNRVVQSS